MEKPFRSHNPLGVLFYKNHRFPEFKEVTILEGPLNSNFFSSLSLSPFPSLAPIMKICPFFDLRSSKNGNPG
jgi:hypothetical protein